jgi:16S rRNA (cytosine1402-N4)-methyltransferase
MRMDPELERTAADIIGRSSESELTKIFREYGEEPRARQIARAIVRRRDREPIRSTRQLAALIESEIPAAIRRRAKIHPATRIFQGLRIAVNDELQSLQTALEQGFDRLRVGGRLVVISFHSLEDRIVKEFLKQKARSCLCPPDFPVCRCNKAKELEVYGPITPTAAEVQANPRSRSAKLRAGIKIASRQGKA